MPTLFGNGGFGSGGESAFTEFEIQLDSEQLLLVGDAYEAEDAVLRGRVVFHNTTPIKVPSVKLALVGEYHASFTNYQNNSYNVAQAGRFYKEELVLYSQMTEAGSSLKPGNHVWPFEFIVKGHQPETVQGMVDTFFAYRLKAVVERGAFVKDHKTYKSVRVVRTYDPTSIALNQSISVDKIWPDKIKYVLSTHSKAVVFGSIIPCEFTLVPLMKGLKIAKTTIILLEEQEFHMKPDANILVPKHPYTREQEIVKDNHKLPSCMETVDVNGLEGYKFIRNIQTPRELGQCRLSIDPVLPHESVVQPYPLVKIKHSLRFVISLMNPDGHISEIRARLPVSLFLTPNQRLNTKHQLTNSGAIPMSRNQDIIQTEFGAPPSYGEHVTDEALEPSSLSNSGLATPNGFLSSRNSYTHVQDAADAQLSANTLHNRLNSLVNPASSRFAAEEPDRHGVLPRVLASSNGASPSNVNGYERDYFLAPRARNQDLGSGGVTPPVASGTQTPSHVEYDSTALSRVPSYNTASRSGPPRNHSCAGLPTYNEAASTPPSPERSGSVSSDNDLHIGAEGSSLPRQAESSRRVHF